MNKKEEFGEKIEVEELFFKNHDVIVGDKVIEVPEEELNDRLNARLSVLRRKGKLPHILACASAVAFLMVLGFVLMVVNPDVRAFAEKVPVIGALINSFYRDTSIEQAKENGFIEMRDIVKEQDGLRFEVGELYFDGLRLAMNAKIYGERLNEYLKEGKQPFPNFSCNIVIEKDKGQKGILSELFKVREGDNNYIYSRMEKVFTESELNYILSNDRRFEVELYFSAGSSINSRLAIPVILGDFTGTKEEDKNTVYSFDENFPVRYINIGKILSSPTLSQMYYKVGMEEDTDFICFQDVYIADTEGRKYYGEQEDGIFRAFPDKNYIREGKDEFKKISGASSRSNIEPDGGFKLNIAPSFYLDGLKPDKLCFDGVHIKKRKKITLDLNSKFPQEITFDGKTVRILSAEYTDGKLIVKLYRDWTSREIEQLNVYYGEGPDDEEYYVDGVDDKFTIGRKKTDGDKREVALEKKDTYDITVEAQYEISKKVEIPLNNFF